MSLLVFVFGGVVLMAAGVLQAFVRPRPADRPRGSVDGAIVRAVVFVVVGLLAVLLGLGVLPVAAIRF